MKKIHLVLAVIFSFMAASLLAQEYASNKEKIYIQTDHVFYKPGDVVFYKLYLVNASSQKPSDKSNVAYVELISPAGTVAQKSKCKVVDGYTDGSFDFTEAAVGGIYKIRAYTTWMQNEKETKFFVKEITLQKVLAPRVLLKLDFPEKGYGANSAVTANFSMRNLSNEPIGNYEGKYTVSLGGNVINTAMFKTNSEGKALVKFNLPAVVTTNDGLLNITINYDSYTEAISRSIPIVLNKIDFQLMPEGGTLVENIPGYIAFKALNENGKAADVKGVVKDSRGNIVSHFETFHFGMGKMLFTAKKGETYKAVITSPANITGEFPLPDAAPDGLALQLTKNMHGVNVNIVSTHKTEVILQASAKGVIYLKQPIKLKKGANEITVDKTLFPAGITQFTVYNSKAVPVAERLLFLNEDKQLQVNITADKPGYLPREQVTLRIKTIDEAGNAVPSNFAMSVVDDKLFTFADDKQDNILSWLLMSSELKGKVEEPTFYFKKEEPKALPALDLVMLTNGYRYFDYTEDVLTAGNLKYMPDQENIVKGQIVNADDKPVQSKVFLINNSQNGNAIEMTTDTDGMFFFTELTPQAFYYLFAQGLNSSEKLTVKVLQNGLGTAIVPGTGGSQLFSKPVDFDMLVPYKKPTPVQDDIAFGKTRKEKIRSEVNFKKEAAHLDEVVVIGAGVQKRRNVTGAVAMIDAKDLMTAATLDQALQGRLAGVDITPAANPFGETKIRIRGVGSVGNNNAPLIVMNGVPMEEISMGTINPADIERITVVKDAAATALFGARAANGVIIIDSKRNGNERIKISLGNKFRYASLALMAANNVYNVAKKFYVPKYSSTTTDTRTDFRETIYWNPIVQTDKNGEATVSFYNSDASTTFRAMAEGIGYNGKPGRAEFTYATKAALQVDAKIPPYLTVGDKALVPLVIKNNTLNVLDLNLTVKVPEHFKTGIFPQNVRVAADSSLQVLVPVEAVAAASGSIEFTVQNGLQKEVISLPVSANDKGFPVIKTFAGNETAQHNFTIDNMVPGSLKPNLKLLRTLEGQLLDGIESMLREPYGCFEQTSSSTYPNIFVLKYLRESGRSSPAIEKKAMDYIQRGYKRLIGFETKNNGFEWFGNTPPHEALTAYGLLEFTDMQQFVDVDKKMLERTKQFLLSRRNGNGSFNIVTQGMDQFASVPAKIANTYIVYALTQAGIGKEIQPEYETAVKKAKESNDGYQLAMMAIAAHNMKDAATYKALIDLLSQQKTSMKAETSVVNSRDASLRVETTALYALALMKSSTPQLAEVAALITKILGEKSYYGYGSTQATVLALQAIVEYSKLVGRVSEDSPVLFTLNNTTVNNDNMLAKLKPGSNIFSVGYPQKDKALPYNLEIAYSTMMPPNSEKAELKINNQLKNKITKVGETVRLDINISNLKNTLQPMSIAKIGIPAGLAVQPWQLKEIMEKKQVAYYEIFDNYLVFYWMGFAPNETKTVHLDLKAETQGTYKAKASNVYLYYTPEYKHWDEGVSVEVK